MEVGPVAAWITREHPPSSSAMLLCSSHVQNHSLDATEHRLGDGSESCPSQIPHQCRALVSSRMNLVSGVVGLEPDTMVVMGRLTCGQAQLFYILYIRKEFLPRLDWFTILE